MSGKLWMLLSIIAALCLAVAAVLCLVHGECGGFLDCNGNPVPMKCHWAYRSAALVAVIGAVGGFAACVQKNPSARRLGAFFCILCAVGVLLVLFAIVGVCGSSEMACVGNRIPVAIALVVAIIADEPTNDLDAENAVRVIDALFSRVKTGEAALIYATHDLELAGLADRRLRIDA